MTCWEWIKHWIGLHGDDAEWLDGRTFIDGSYLRTYYCPTCKVVFHQGNGWAWNPRQLRLSYEQLKAERDAGRNAMMRILMDAPHTYTARKPFSMEDLDKEMNLIGEWLKSKAENDTQITKQD